jgi:hypothetical protein
VLRANSKPKAKVEYVVGMPENIVLERRARREMHAAQVLTERFEKKTTLFGETDYARLSVPM